MTFHEHYITFNQLDQPEFFLSRERLLDPATYVAHVAAYKTYYTEVIRELGGNVTEAAKDVDAVISFETLLAKVASPEAVRGNISPIYNPKRLDAYEAELGQLGTINPCSRVCA